MKLKLSPGFLLLCQLIIILIVFFCMSCNPPVDPPVDPPPEIRPQAELRFQYHIDPYIVRDKCFNLCLVMDISNAVLGEYDFSVIYDTSKIVLNKGDNNGVSPGLDGFVTSVDASAPGKIQITGIDQSGTGPGRDLQLLIISFYAVDSGTTNILLRVKRLMTTDGLPIDANDPVNYRIKIKEPSFFPLTGQVLDSIGGSPVTDAMAALEGTDYVAMTDVNGFFDFQEILIGVYNIIVTKTGRAGSKLEQVHVSDDQSSVEIIQPTYDYIPDAVTPPSIIVRGIEREKEYSGIIPINITIIQGSCPVIATGSHKSIYLKIGMTKMTYNEVASSEDDTLSFKWNTSLLPPGEVFIKVVTYDTNNNRSERNIPVFTTIGSGEKPGVAPRKEYYSIIAATYGQSKEILRKNPVFSVILEQSLHTSRAPADCTVLVDFSVEKYYNGIVVYKSHTRDGPYILVCHTSFVDSHYYKCTDYSPDLEPGRKVFYKLAYFNSYGIGPQTDSISVQLLPKYNLSLVSPANNSIVTDTSVTLTWTCDPFLENAIRRDWIMAINILDGTIVAYSFVSNKLEYTLNDLLYNNSYEWDVRSLYEYVDPEEPSNVISRSFPRGDKSHDYSLNGSFIFTVIQQE